MKIVNGLQEFQNTSSPEVILALGNFDGVHLGHQQVIKTAVDKAKHYGIESAALIFDPHPLNVLAPNQEFKPLTDLETRAELLAKRGLDYLIIEPFTHKLAEMPPEEFLYAYLHPMLKIKGLVAGYDYTFGHRAKGNTELLVRWGEKENLDIVICPPVKFNEEPVSSSVIRGKIQHGEMEITAKFLNYYFFRRGRVIPGRGTGKKLGFPTANLELNTKLILPQEGVYFTLVQINDKLYSGATNIGKCPTFSLGNLSVEVNILNFQGQLYNEYLTLYFIKKLREEKEFSSTEKLKKQLQKDIETVRALSDYYLDFSYVLQH